MYSTVTSVSKVLLRDGTSHHHQEGETKGEGDANSDGVSSAPRISQYLTKTLSSVLIGTLFTLWLSSGLDNAGKTTIVKRVNGEDASSVSPTLGFSISTMLFGR